MYSSNVQDGSEIFRIEKNIIIRDGFEDLRCKRRLRKFIYEHTCRDNISVCKISLKCEKQVFLRAKSIIAKFFTTEYFKCYHRRDERTGEPTEHGSSDSNAGGRTKSQSLKNYAADLIMEFCRVSARLGYNTTFLKRPK